jgi:hypothetical protein
MKRRSKVLIIFFVYVTLLLILMGHNDVSEELVTSFTFSIDRIIRFILISFIASNVFLIFVSLINNNFSLYLIFLTPLLNIFVSLVVSSILNTIFQLFLLNDISIYQISFLIATISTVITTMILSLDIFNSKNPKKC